VTKGREKKKSEGMPRGERIGLSAHVYGTDMIYSFK
jgi:hypothetical protein